MKKNSVFHFSSHAMSGVTLGELVLHDQSSRNSFKLDASRELLKMLPQIEKTCDVLLFRSEGRVFCSGGNLKDHLALGPAKSKQANREITKCLARLSGLSVPTVALVQGDVFGGGLELLSAFDVVIAVPEAVFGVWQRRLGLSFGWGGGARLSRVTSPADLTRLALESKPLTASEAKTIGFVDHIEASWTARTRAIALALGLASLPKDSVATLKKIKSVPAADARREQRAFEKLWFGPTHKARLAAFTSNHSSRARPSR